MMIDKIKSPEKDPALIETPKGSDYRAVIDTENVLPAVNLALEPGKPP